MKYTVSPASKGISIADLVGDTLGKPQIAKLAFLVQESLQDSSESGHNRSLEKKHDFAKRYPPQWLSSAMH